MASKLRVKIKRARDLPVMDRNQNVDASTDAFVETRIGEQMFSTQIIKKSLNPQWNEEFIFEFVDDTILQSAPIEFKVLDQDTYSTELIGAVYVDANPLLMRTAYTADAKDLSIRGWFHLFDTAHGLRGMLEVSIQLIFIGNSNTSPAGVHFFSSSSLSSYAFILKELYGFVEDMVVEDDPESSWRDYFRKATKASHDQRWKAVYSLNNQVRSEVARKVFEAGGNAVLGFKVTIDMPSPTAIVARAHGTACKLYKVDDTNSIHSLSGVIRAKLTNDYSNTVTCTIMKNLELRYGWFGGIFDSMELLHAENDSMLAHVIRSTSLARNQLSPLNSSGDDDNADNRASLTAEDRANCELPVYMNINSNTGTCEEIMALIPFGPTEKQGMHGDVSGSSNAGGLIRNNVNSRGGMMQGLGNKDSDEAGIGAGGNTTGNTDAGMFSSHKQDVILFPIKVFPSHIRIRLGGLVCARSVKYLGIIINGFTLLISNEFILLVL